MLDENPIRFVGTLKQDDLGTFVVPDDHYGIDLPMMYGANSFVSI
jgi:hypothetical protein